MTMATTSKVSTKQKYTWAKQTADINEEIIATFDPYKEWNQDEVGYFLIRLNQEKQKIEVGFVTNDHVIRKVIVGTKANEIYMTLIRKKLVSRLEHAAYLGKELMKAELALKYGKEYRQEGELQI